jgi:hypothetical protein
MSSNEPGAQHDLLADRLIAVAGTPDDSDRIGTELIIIAQLAATRIAAVDAASVTGRCGEARATVAASSDLAVDADKAQYREDAGPCLEALTTGQPVAVADIATAGAWPGFRETAGRLGLRTSLSIPLFAGSGRTLAALNLYSRRPGALTALAAAIGDAHHPQEPCGWNHDDLDDGGRELIAGVIGALALRSMIQRALRILPSCGDDGAYMRLRMQAAETGASLTDLAVDVIEQGHH